MEEVLYPEDILNNWILRKASNTQKVDRDMNSHARML